MLRRLLIWRPWKNNRAWFWDLLEQPFLYLNSLKIPVNNWRHSICLMGTFIFCIWWENVYFWREKLWRFKWASLLQPWHSSLDSSQQLFKTSSKMMTFQCIYWEVPLYFWWLWWIFLQRFPLYQRSSFWNTKVSMPAINKSS